MSWQYSLWCHPPLYKVLPCKIKTCKPVICDFLICKGLCYIRIDFIREVSLEAPLCLQAHWLFQLILVHELASKIYDTVPSGCIAQYPLLDIFYDHSSCNPYLFVLFGALQKHCIAVVGIYHQLHRVCQIGRASCRERV